jgi:hypothetical protein
MKETILTIVAAFVMLFVFWCILREYRYKNFQKTMKAGDACYFYLWEGDRFDGKIENIYADTVLISYCETDGVKNMIRVSKSDVYPIN